MLKHLYIKNFVLIDEISLDFQAGFSAFTGETGAGKSILLDAISTLCSLRASSSYISKGKQQAIIEGTFDLTKDAHACKVMEESGFEVNDETTFTRTLLANGKSNARIDHRVAPISLMNDILRDEIDIHGQRDTAYLLNANTHMHLLDEYVQDDVLLQQVKQAYQTYEALCKEREKALAETYNENDAEYFTYQIQEITDANLQVGEEEQLQQKEKQYKIIKDSLEKAHAIFTLYEDSIQSNLYELNHLVDTLKSDETIEKIQTSINDSYYGLSDAMEQLHAYFSEEEMDEEDINAMEERLFTIQKLKRKYGRTIQDILDKKDELEKQVEMITHRNEYLHKMNAKVEKAKDAYDALAIQLTKVRKEGRESLDASIQQQLHDLMLPNATFYTEISEGKPSASGSDKVEFLIRMNVGEDLKPLVKSASGGELSRLMLGLKVIFTKLQGIQTVIFDEIDTGVSGPVATAIGRKMKLLSKSAQVFSVTHLAQVAACSDHHYFVSKTSDHNATTSTVSLLNEKQTIEQLALIASGEITDASLRAAKELYQRNHK